MKIPFAIRKGEIICISDLSLAERGLESKCYCIGCNVPLIARMGEINIHHFAHSTKGCNEGQAYVLGMYMLMKELLDRRKELLVPGIKLEYRCVAYTINVGSIENLVKVVPSICEERKGYQYKMVVGDRVVTVGESSIEYKGNEQVEALVLRVKGRELAIKIVLPDSICKRYSTKAYKKLPTLEIDFRLQGYDLNALTKQQIEEILIEQLENKSWIYNPHPKLEAVYKEIINENEEYFIKYKKDIKNTPRRSYRGSDVQPMVKEVKQDWKSKEQYEEGFKEIEKIFNKDESNYIIKDKYGYRWIYCQDCHQIKRDEEMPMQGEVGLPNQGRCRVCYRKMEIGQKKAIDIQRKIC